MADTNILNQGGDLWAAGRNFGQDVAKALTTWFNADAVESNVAGDEWTIYRYGKNVTLKIPKSNQPWQAQRAQLEERMWLAKRHLDAIAT